MELQTTIISKLFPTLITNIRFLSRMDAGVALECQCVTEACAADGACVRSLSCMDPLMDLEMLLTVKVSLTQATTIQSSARGKCMALGTIVIAVVELWEVALLT